MTYHQAREPRDTTSFVVIVRTMTEYLLFNAPDVLAFPLRQGFHRGDSTSCSVFTM
jgi:hypothetical protein